jgi:flagellar protein FlbD
MKNVRALIVDDSSDLIKFVERSPDTVITLINGEKILVQEQVSDIVPRIVEFRHRVLIGSSAWNQTPALAFSGQIASRGERED